MLWLVSKYPLSLLNVRQRPNPILGGKKTFRSLKGCQWFEKNRILFRGNLPRRRADTFTAGVQARRLQPESDPPLINSARNDVGIPIAPRNLMRDDLFFQKCSDLLF